MIGQSWHPGRFVRLVKEGSWIVAGQMGTVLGAIFSVRIITEYLEPLQYGQLALGLTISSLGCQVIGGITAGISRFYPLAAAENDLPSFLHSSFRMMMCATILLMAISLMLMAGMVSLGFSQWIGLVGAASIFSVLSCYNASLSSIQNAARQRAIVAFHSGLNAWMKILLAVSIILCFGSSSTSVMIGYALSALLVNVSQLFFLRRLIRPPSEKIQTLTNWETQMWAYSWPFAIWSVFTWVQQISDRWVLQSFTTTQEVGLYAVVFQLGYVPISLLSSLISTFISPILFRLSGNATNENSNISVHLIVCRIAYFNIFITGLLFAFTYFYHEWIFSLLVAATYHSASYLLPWVILAGGLFSAGQTLSLRLMCEMLPASLTLPKISTAILGVGLNIYGASHFGLRGLVAALVGFSAAYLCWMACLSRRSYQNNRLYS